jgi:hypothetical protein
VLIVPVVYICPLALLVHSITSAGTAESSKLKLYLNDMIKAAG